MSSSSESPVDETEAEPKPRRIPTITQMVYGRKSDRPEKAKRPPNHSMTSLGELHPEIWENLRSLI